MKRQGPEFSLSNEVFEDLIPLGSSLILVPQTPRIEIMVSQKLPILIKCSQGPHGAKSRLFYIKVDVFGRFDPLMFIFKIKKCSPKLLETKKKYSSVSPNNKELKKLGNCKAKRRLLFFRIINPTIAGFSK